MNDKKMEKKFDESKQGLKTADMRTMADLLARAKDLHSEISVLYIFAVKAIGAGSGKISDSTRHDMVQMLHDVETKKNNFFRELVEAFHLDEIEWNVGPEFMGVYEYLKTLKT